MRLKCDQFMSVAVNKQQIEFSFYLFRHRINQESQRKILRQSIRKQIHRFQIHHENLGLNKKRLKTVREL